MYCNTRYHLTVLVKWCRRSLPTIRYDRTADKSKAIHPVVVVELDCTVFTVQFSVLCSSYWKTVNNGNITSTAVLWSQVPHFTNTVTWIAATGWGEKSLLGMEMKLWEQGGMENTRERQKFMGTMLREKMVTKLVQFQQGNYYYYYYRCKD